MNVLDMLGQNSLVSTLFAALFTSHSVIFMGSENVF